MGSGPTLVRLEQSAGPGSGLSRTPAGSDYPFKRSLSREESVETGKPEALLCSKFPSSSTLELSCCVGRREPLCVPEQLSAVSFTTSILNVRNGTCHRCLATPRLSGLLASTAIGWQSRAALATVGQAAVRTWIGHQKRVILEEPAKTSGRLQRGEVGVGLGRAASGGGTTVNWGKPLSSLG